MHRWENINLILENEYHIIENDLEKHANTNVMKSSLKEALFDLSIIKKNLDCVSKKNTKLFTVSYLQSHINLKLIHQNLLIPINKK